MYTYSLSFGLTSLNNANPIFVEWASPSAVVDAKHFVLAFFSNDVFVNIGTERTSIIGSFLLSGKPLKFGISQLALHEKRFASTLNP